MRVWYATRARLAAAALLPLAVWGCSPSAEDARTALERTGVPVDMTGFVDAARDRGPQTLGLFLAAGLDPNRLETRNGISPLMAAAAAGRLENAKFLIEKGASVRFRTREGETPLMFATQACNNLEMVNLLLDAGADPNASDSRGDTPLLKFIHQPRNTGECRKEVLRALVGAGARVDQEDAAGETALMRAVKRRQPMIVSALLEAGADAKRHSSKTGETALHGAVLLDDPEIARLLLRAGADPNAVDREGRTVLVRVQGRPQMERLLLDAGAAEPYTPVPSEGMRIDQEPAQPEENDAGNETKSASERDKTQQ